MADSLRIQNKTMKSKINDVNEAGFMKNTGGIVMTINNGKLEIKSGTVEKLIERLWNQDQLSVSEYVDIFLHTYRSFTTSKVVWDTMMSVYEKHARIINPPNQSIRWSTVIRAEQEELTNQKIRLRIIALLKRWLEHHYHDFEGELIEKFHQFINNCPHESEIGLLSRVLEVVEKKRNGEITDIVGFSDPAPDPIFNPSLSICIENIHVIEIARQLTILDSQLYKEIPPKELLSLSWQAKDKAERSKNLLKMIERFNQASNWAIVCIVRETDLKRRSQLLKKFILITEELYKLSNFNGVFQITSALVSSPVSRLTKTWEQIGLKWQQKFQKFLDFSSPSGNFQSYREVLSSISVACIPYIGLFLSDLTFIEEGNPDFLENGFVNFIKSKMVADVIRQIQRFQKRPFNLKTVPSIQQYLWQHQTLSEKECFQLSLIAEPRTH